MELGGRGQAGRCAGAHVERGALMRVLAVTQHLAAGPHGGHQVRPAGLAGNVVGRVRGGEPGCDGGVVAGGGRVGGGGQPPPLPAGEAARPDRLGGRLVLRRVGDHGDPRMVLRGRPDHGRAADVDLLDALGRRGPGGDRGLERVQAGHQQLEGFDTQAGELLGVPGPAGVGEQTGMDGGMQGLHPAFQAFGKPGHVLHAGHRQARRGDGRRRAAGADDLHTGGRQHAGQLGQPGLVVDADQRPLDRNLRHFLRPLHPWRAWFAAAASW